MNGGVGELVDLVDGAVLGVVSDVVAGEQVDVVGDHDAGVGGEVVTGPPQPDVLDLVYPWRLGQDIGRVRCHVRVDCIHEAAVDIERSSIEDEQDCHRDKQPHDGVGEREAEQNSGGPCDDSERGEAMVRACRPSATRAAEPILRPTRIR